jgi:hypothetical protein
MKSSVPERKASIRLDLDTLKRKRAAVCASRSVSFMALSARIAALSYARAAIITDPFGFSTAVCLLPHEKRPPIVMSGGRMFGRGEAHPRHPPFRSPTLREACASV